MDRQSFIAHVANRTSTRLSLLRDKGEAYSGNEDAFANFKRNGEKLGLSRFQIWSVYCGKHLDAIFGAIRRSPSYPVDKSEGMEGRIDDAINYLELLSGMLREATIGQVATEPDGSLPSTDAVATHIINLTGGNGLSSDQQKELIKQYLEEVYGPRNFAL